MIGLLTFTILDLLNKIHRQQMILMKLLKIFLLKLN